MKSSEIREKFLKYFEKKGHKILPGSSLVPADPTVLLTLAGMLQFKSVFLGEEKPKYRRVATVQKCLRMVDVDQVGKTPRHHTFFEMLGNFSFGDYFKKEAIQYAWELLTTEFKLPADKLLVAVYDKDDEAYQLWNGVMGLPSQKIYRLGEENNFWAVGPTGPCGPCSEIYWDFGSGKGCGKPTCQPGCDCDRYLEIWNLVFIQYNRNKKGLLIPLKRKGIDTGMGLERVASILQGVETNFDTDLFLPLIGKIKEEASEVSPISVSIIADHLRAMVHLITDGVLPDNTGRGYILRSLIRRAVRHGRLLGIHKPFLYRLTSEVVKLMQKSYPQLSKFTAQVVGTEEKHFGATLEQGLQRLKELINKPAGKIISGREAFELHDTFGFPIGLTKEIAKESGFAVDEKGFDEEMEKQKEKGRVEWKKKKEYLTLELNRFPPTKFTGYGKESDESKVLAVFPKEKLVILEKTPFYGESGGQVGDTGILSFDKSEVRVVDTQLGPSGVILHKLESVEGLKERKKVRAQIDSARRKAIAVHHTATHLLQAALRKILGKHIRQSGSFVGPDRLRFDFTHFAGVSSEELDRVEDMINAKIKEKVKTEALQKPYKEAIKMGALALFGEKYGEKVRVLKIRDYSLELCGGTHLKNTSDILFFKIVSESAVGAGIRRIEAVAGRPAEIYVMYKAKALRDRVKELIQKLMLLHIEKKRLGGAKEFETGIFEIELTELQSLGKAADTQASAAVRLFLDHLQGRVDWLKERIAREEKAVAELKLKRAREQAILILPEVEEIAGIKILGKDFPGYTMEMLRTASDTLQAKLKSCILVLASILEGKVIFLVTVTADLVAKGCSARDLASRFAEIVGGKSGGKNSKAEGGGGDPVKIKEAFERVYANIRN